MMNARFWTHMSNGVVKLTVKPGETLRWHSFERHDEGWSSEAHEWSSDGYTLFHSVTIESRDCDGRHDWRGSSATSTISPTDTIPTMGCSFPNLIGSKIELDVPHCYLVETRYHGPTTFRGSRISAKRSDGWGKTIWWKVVDHLTMNNNHLAAAELACKGHKIIGTAESKRGYYFIVDPRYYDRKNSRL